MPATEINKDRRIGFEEIMKDVRQLDNSALVKFAGEINRLVSVRTGETSEKKEMELLKKIKNGIPASLKRRQKQLYSVMQQSSITSVEHDELVLLNNLIEEKTAERITFIGELAKLHGITIQELSAQSDTKTIHE